MQLVDNYVTMFRGAGPLDLLFYAAVHLGPLLALIVGRRLERAIAAVYLVSMVAAWGTGDLGTESTAALGILYLFVIGAIALRRGAPGWTLFATAFQLVQVLTWLLAMAAELPLNGFLLLSLMRTWEYLFIFALVIGAFNSRRAAPGIRRARDPGAGPGAAPDGVPG